MASSDNADEAEKYKNLSLSQLQEECRKREISFDEKTLEAGLINLLLKDDRKPTDWGAIYARLLDAGLRYDDIPKRTLVQIKAILGEWAHLVSIRTPPGLFGGLGGTPLSEPVKSGEHDSQEDVDSFFNSF